MIYKDGLRKGQMCVIGDFRPGPARSGITQQMIVQAIRDGKQPLWISIEANMEATWTKYLPPSK